MDPKYQLTIGPPTFTERTIHIWAIKMKTYKKALNIWEIIELTEPVVHPLRINAALNEIK